MDETDDKKWPDYEPPAASETRAETRDAVGDPLPVDPTPAVPSAGTNRSLVVALATTAVLVAGAVFGAVALAGGGDDDGDRWDDPYDDPTEYRTLITQEDLDAIAVELERAEGSTDVTGVSIDDSQHSRDDVRIEVTAAPHGNEKLAARYLYSGDGWELLDAVEADEKPFDLSLIQPAAIEDVILELREDATEDGDGITATGVIIHAPTSDYDNWIWVSLDETDDETWFGRADLDGNISDSGQF